ncbi:MAG: ABC transporter ATP-binding protein [Candidatus Thermoplasmatota archaeon]|nr:ABC transporter ATP-binding protein [Candidatus Thermoplasmatota archaeon]
MIAISVEGLEKNFGSVKAVDGASFSVSAGEIFGLIGPNGAGKSTTLRIVSTLLQPSNGSVNVFGHDVVKEASEVRKLISYLPEDAGAYKNLKGIEYLNFMAEFFVKNREEREQMVKRAVELSALGERLNDKISTYSKGMMRKILVARALMIKPKLAILDEPTGGLDVLNAREVRDTVKRFAKEGTAFLLSSHNMLEVDFLCDRIALIDRGRIVETGKPAELKEKYKAANIEDVFVEVIS